MVKSADTLTSGDLRSTVRLERRLRVDDGKGNPVSGDWQAQFQRRAYLQVLRGGESVIASRLQGTAPTIIVVRFDRNTSSITPDWRVVELGTCEIIYAIRQASDMERKRRWITLLCESGVAA